MLAIILVRYKVGEHMRILGLALILISCTILGFVYDSQEKKRVLQLEELLFGFNLLKSEIEYKLTPLIEALKLTSAKTGNGIDKLFYLYAYKLEQRNETDEKKMWKDTLIQSSKLLKLTEEDLKIIEPFGDISFLDRETQKININWLLEELKRKKDDANEIYQKRSKVYCSMGILLGLSIVIVLI
ncbi:hypothetical protein AN641_02250 [Candidatus Epulonipiscioides gigas]|nr:hypothetical protein AN641_02250 [Epulopiscium sp. SCG-C07WGA-EpuloA2]